MELLLSQLRHAIMSPLAGLEMRTQTTNDTIALERIKLIRSRLELLFEYFELIEGKTNLIPDEQAIESLKSAIAKVKSSQPTIL